MNTKKFRNKFFNCALIILLGFIGYQSAWATDVAITVDDLPISGPLPPNTTRMDLAKQMLAVFKKHHIKEVYGFINGGVTSSSQGMAVFKVWVDDGQLLGNHTYTHENLAKMSSQAYIQNIKKNDPILMKMMGNKDYKYFRYPFLAEGNTAAKRDAVRNYLASQGYKIAPVTVDFADYQFNPSYVRCLRKNNLNGAAWVEQNFIQQSVSALQRAQATSQFLFHRDMKQILLIHPGACDVKALDKMLTAYENHGVKFVSLPVAMSDDAYKINPSFSDTKGYTFLNQIKKMRGLKTPRSVNKYYITFPEKQLMTVCR